jgi:23S rRNA (cytidine2498-2'-O)-methyltransferase
MVVGSRAGRHPSRNRFSSWPGTPALAGGAPGRVDKELAATRAAAAACVPVDRARAVRDAGRLRAGLDLLEAAAPGAIERGGRGFAHYWSLIQAGSNSVWCVEDREGVVGIFLGTPHRAGRWLYYDIVVSPQVEPHSVVADLVDTGAAAAHGQGWVRLTSHEPLDGPEFYESIGHVPTMRVQINGPGRSERRQALVSAMSDHRLLAAGESDDWVDASFRVDRVDLALRSQLSEPEQYAMHMMHRWSDPGCRPRYVVSGYERFARANVTELRQIDPRLTKVARLHGDTTEMAAGAPGHDLVPAIEAQAVTFAHSVVPVDVDVKLAGDAGDVDLIVEAANALPIEKDSTFAVECRKGTRSVGGRHPDAAYTTRDIEIRLGTALFAATRCAVDLSAPEQIVSVYLEGDRALVGLAGPPFADQHRRRASNPTIISRAEHKLAEALDSFDVPLPAGARAIDLGAAPGGWSYLLAQRGIQVYAVDPGALNPAVTAHPLVTHLQARAEHIELDGGPVDLIVNDMNLDPGDSARLMCAAGAHLRPGAHGIMTIKLPSTRPDPGIAAAHAVLVGAYEIMATRHLPHNRQEVTTLLRRRPRARRAGR